MELQAVLSTQSLPRTEEALEASLALGAILGGLVTAALQTAVVVNMTHIP
jgi:hypothetical protein